MSRTPLDLIPIKRALDGHIGLTYRLLEEASTVRAYRPPTPRAAVAQREHLAALELVRETSAQWQAAALEPAWKLALTRQQAA